MRLKLIKSFIGGLAALLFLTVGSPSVLAEAKAYAVLEAETERVLLESNAEERLPMASTTKIMTCIVAIEQCPLDTLVTVDSSAAGIEGSSMYLRAGETLSMEQLLYGLMISSGNDAACAIAIHIAGSVPDFCAIMNKKAAEIGALNTNFTTPNGLPDDNHYTTAKDLGRIACYAMRNETFRSIVSATSIDLPADEDSPARYLRSKNKILYQYDGGNGIKTGFTKAAGKCLVAGALREDMQLISVVLNDYDMFNDSMALLNTAFEGYSMTDVLSSGEDMGSIPVQGGLEKSVSLSAAQEISLPLAENEVNMVERKIIIPECLDAPVKRGDTAGTVEIYFNGELYASSDILADGDVPEDTFMHHFMRVIRDFLGERGSIENSKISGSGGSGVET